MNTKKIAASALLLALLLGLAACSSPSGNSSSDTPSAEDPVTYIELDEVLEAELYGIGFRNDDIALGLEVQKHLDDMIADGTAAAISETWFGTDALLKDQTFLEQNEASEEDSSLQAILDKGKLVVGLDDSYPPMGFRDDSNTIVGFDIDLAREVASRMGVEVEFQPIAWSAKEMELDSGAIDCIWNGMTITEERQGTMYFTKPYIANEQIIIVASNSGIASKADLEGKIIGHQAGSSSEDALMKDPVSEKVASVQTYEDNVTAYLDLQAGRIDALVVDSVVGRYMLSQD